MANRESAILLAVEAILNADAPLAAYNKQVFKGVRSNIPKNHFPCVILEPVRTSEHTSTTDRHHQMNFQLDLHCFTEHFDWDKILIGDANQKGIMDFTSDIKNAIDAFPNLNYDATVPRCNRFVFTRTEFRMDAYPYRYAIISMDTYWLTTGPTNR